MINSNQPAAILLHLIWLGIIWRFDYFFIHIQPWFALFIWNWCEVNICRKSFIFKRIIRFELNIHFVCWNWYDFLIPVTGRCYRFGTLIWTCQICYQWLISICINFLYCYVITIIMKSKLLKKLRFRNNSQNLAVHLRHVFITYINYFKIYCYIMTLWSSDTPYAICQWIKSIWVIGWSYFHIYKIYPILTWVMIDIFYSTCPSRTTFAKVV